MRSGLQVTPARLLMFGVFLALFWEEALLVQSPSGALRSDSEAPYGSQITLECPNDYRVVLTPGDGVPEPRTLEELGTELRQIHDGDAWTVLPSGDLGEVKRKAAAIYVLRKDRTAFVVGEVRRFDGGWSAGVTKWCAEHVGPAHR